MAFNLTKSWWSLPFNYDYLADERTRHWPLVESFWQMAALVVLYLLVVAWMPRWMEKRTAFQLKTVLIVYNMLMAALNAHIFIELLVCSIHLKYDYWCQPCLPLYSHYEMRIATAIWLFYISKFVEFSDTIFFILRKKSSQLSFLHVYHHSTMFPLWWIAVKWVPSGSTFFPAMVNSFVHVVMYTYYGLSALGSFMIKYLWWKKYLTLLQLLQFTIGIMWSTQALATNCNYPTWISYANIVYMSIFLILFGRFYRRMYRKKIK